VGYFVFLATLFLATFLVAAFLRDRLAGFLCVAFFGDRLAVFFVAFFVVAMSLAPPERAPGAAMIFPLGTLRGEAAQTKHGRTSLALNPFFRPYTHV